MSAGFSSNDHEGKPMKQIAAVADHGAALPPLLIRLAVGPTMFAHGYNKVFGSGGLEGTERWFAGLGFQPAAVHARVAAATEMASGALITLGALNPLPSAAVIGVMTVAARSDHRGKGFFVFKGGSEYVVVLSAAATALAALGNGPWSIDRVIRNRRRGRKWAMAAAALGLANGALLLATSFRPQSIASETGHAAEPPAVADDGAADRRG